MKYYLYLSIFFILVSFSVNASIDLASRLGGFILIQPEQNGEAWYVSPINLKKYFLGRPDDAFSLMKTLGRGISNNDLEKIPIGLVSYSGLDTDKDGLIDNLEISLGTDINNIDSDGDGFDDKNEILNAYNPLDSNSMEYDNILIENNLGAIFIQTENNGEAWYVDPQSKKRYFLSRPDEAFSIMKELALGISNENIKTIISETIEPKKTTPKVIPPAISNTFSINKVANEIRRGDKKTTSEYFVEDMKYFVEYTLDYLDDEGRLSLGNILSGSSLNSSSNEKLVYRNTVFFNGENHDIYFNVEKQENGTWLMTNL